LPGEHAGINVLIEGNTMRVGNQIYHLGNIARVSTYDRPVGFRGGPLKAAWTKRWRFLGILAGLSVAGSFDSLWAWIPVALLLWAAGATVVQIVRMLRRRGSERVLLIESTSGVRGLLASRDPHVIGEIVTLISDSMRNPPFTVVERHFNNVTTNVSNTEINQFGDGNVGQAVRMGM
jgi:Family of unknown function (DUF6232)